MDADSDQHNQDAKEPLEIPPGIILEVAEKFVPFRSAVSESWRTQLLEMRRRFSEIADTQEKLTCVLTHSVEPEWPSRPDGPYPAEVDGMEPIAMGRGPSRWPQQYFLRKEGQTETVVSEFDPMSGKSYRLKMLDISSKLRLGSVEFAPMAGDRTVHNVTGNPIQYSNRQPVAMRQGVNRNYFVHGGGEAHERIKSVTSFFSLAGEAGQCLYVLPSEVNRTVWREWPEGFRTIGDKGMWISALFELAWQQPKGSFNAVKFAWNGPTSIPIDDASQSQQVSVSDEVFDASAEDPNSPPHWYSVIDDLVAASIVAVDVLLAIDNEDGGAQDGPGNRHAPGSAG